MIELEKTARELAQKFPVGHPERAALLGMAQIAENWGKTNSTQKPESLQPEQLIALESTAWKGFFGREIKIPVPSQELIDVQNRAQEAGMTSFEAHFLPKVELKQNAKHPGWKVKPEPWFWDKIKEGKIDKSASKLSGNWVLIDATPKPDYDNGKQVYPNDPFGHTLATLRKMNAILVPHEYRHVPETSRFAVTPEERQNSFYKTLAGDLKTDPKRVRDTKAIEFNIIGNIHHPKWGQTSTWEWFNDKFEDGYRLIGGGSGSGGLAVVNDGWRDDRSDGVGFRPLVEFSS